MWPMGEYEGPTDGPRRDPELEVLVSLFFTYNLRLCIESQLNELLTITWFLN